jgi:hypothetical protein
VATTRSTIVALAGVLEAHRSVLKQNPLKSDEGAPFDIANNFDLRHRKAYQRTDYDSALLEWIFHGYLATISLIQTPAARQQAVSRPAPPSPLADDEPF